MLRARRGCERTVKDTKVRAGRAGGGHAAFGKLRSTCPLLTATTLSPLRTDTLHGLSPSENCTQWLLEEQSCATLGQ